MRAFSLAEVAAPLQATLHGTDMQFEAVSTDSRNLRAGELFVALRGDNFDGHRFIGDAARRQAAAAVVSKVSKTSSKDALPTLQVADTRRALGDLGAFNRQHYQGELLAITGSSGKTSVKNMLAAILRHCAVPQATLATRENFNNEIGVPLTLLQLSPQHRYAVVEMGACKIGDIDYLCWNLG